MTVITDEMLEAAQKVFSSWGYSASNPKCLRSALEAALSAAGTNSRDAEPVAWLDDGSLRAGSESTAHRVVTDAQKNDMPNAIRSSFTVPLFAAPRPSDSEVALREATNDLIAKVSSFNGVCGSTGSAIADRLKGEMYFSLQRARAALGMGE